MVAWHDIIGPLVFEHLQIYDRRERFLVGAADMLLSGYSAASRVVSPSRKSGEPTKILLLRLERIGDLLMTLGAIDAIRARAPRASIHLVVGSWNAPLVPMMSAIDSYETLDVRWLSRGSTGIPHSALLRRAVGWRSRGFDLAINFEPDIRTNLLLALSGATRRVGFSTGGGGAFLTDALAYEPQTHTADNARRAVERAFPGAHVAVAPSTARLQISEDAKNHAQALLGNGAASHVFVGVHPSGGRLVKQWHTDRLADVATRLARDLSATVILTGTPHDRALVDRITSLLPADVRHLDLTGKMDLPVLAAVLQQLRLFVTADTGPMHLAAAVGTPTVAIFGPSDPNRYGPLNDRTRVVTADLWCRPCNRVRRPPDRCTGHVPDCLDRIDANDVYRAARELA
jgi:ADP-heptose:LPS heptosyltransferase